MTTAYEASLILYKELREILEKEKEDIAASDLDRLEHYCAVKEEIIQKLSRLETRGLAARNQLTGNRLEADIREILLVHEENAKALLEIRDRLATELTGLQAVKTTLKAYDIHAKA